MSSSSPLSAYDDEKGFFSLAPAQSFLPKRRSHRILGFLAILVVGGTLGRFYVGTERAAELYFNVKSIVTWSTIPVDPLIEQLLSPSLVGLDVPYIERELSTDFANYGGLDASVDPETGGSRAAGYNALAIAIPGPSITPIFEQYRGLRCSSRFPLSTCPFPGQCPTAADDAPERVKNGFPCAVWAEGRPAALSAALNRGGMTRMDARDHRSARVAWDWDREGLWRGQFWQPLSSPEATRPYHYFTPAQSHQCLAGRRVLFLGDSMVRQSFTKLVSYLRGIPIACEHAAERTPAAYYVFADGTDLYDPAASHGSHPQALFSIFYEYHDTHHDSYAKVLSNNIDTIFNGIVYSQPGSQDLAAVQRGIDRLFTRGWRGTLTWYLTPQKSHQDRYEFKERNDQMRQFTSYMRGNYTNIAFNSVPADKLTSRAAGFTLARNRAGGVHPDQFGCSFNTAAPTDIQPGLSAIYAPPGFDTRDLYNWNVIQLWLNGVCDLSSLH